MAHVQFANSHDIREDDTMKFATTIRSALSSEPARRWFEGEVGNGFKYLDHALAKVIAGPQEDDEYAIFKTPGRRRDPAQRERAAAAGSSRPRSALFPSHQRAHEKENLAPPEKTLPRIEEGKDDQPNPHSHGFATHPHPIRSNSGNTDIRGAQSALSSPPISQPADQAPATSSARQQDQSVNTHVSASRPPIVVVRRPAPVATSDGPDPIVAPTQAVTSVAPAVVPAIAPAASAFAVPVNFVDLSTVVESAVEEGALSIPIVKPVVDEPPLAPTPVASTALDGPSTQPANPSEAKETSAHKSASTTTKFCFPSIPAFKPRVTAPPVIAQTQVLQPTLPQFPSPSLDATSTVDPPNPIVDDAAKIQAAPVQAAPVQAAPVQAAPVQAAPGQVAIVQPTPHVAAPTKTPHLPQGTTPTVPVLPGGKRISWLQRGREYAALNGKRSSAAPAAGSGSRASAASFLPATTPAALSDLPVASSLKRKSEQMPAEDPFAAGEHRLKTPRFNQAPVAAPAQQDGEADMSLDDTDGDSDGDADGATEDFIHTFHQHMKSIKSGRSIGGPAVLSLGTTADNAGSDTRLAEERQKEEDKIREHESAAGAERNRVARLEAQRAQEAAEAAERDRVARLEAEHERQRVEEEERQRQEAERQHRAKAEAEAEAKRHAEATRIARERHEEAERAEQQRRKEAERAERQRRVEAEARKREEDLQREAEEKRLEQERLDRERRVQERREQERREQEHLEQERKRLQEQRIERERLEEERLERERAEEERRRLGRLQQEEEERERRHQEEARLRREEENQARRLREDEACRRQEEHERQAELQRLEVAKVNASSHSSGVSDPSSTSQTLVPANQSSIFKPPPKLNNVTSSVFKPRNLAQSTGPFREVFSRAANPVVTKAPTKAPVSAHSTIASIASDKVFDTDSSAPGWAPRTQDTEVDGSQPAQHLDDDDLENEGQASWLIADDVDPTQAWNLLPRSGSVPPEDTTWSTKSLKLELARDQHEGSPLPEAVQEPRPLPIKLKAADAFEGVPSREGSAEVMDTNEEGSRGSSRQPTMDSVDSSQESNPVASSSNFIMDGASKLMSTVFGKKPPVKSIQLAVAARKDEEEKERKAQVLRNAETRRLLAKQRKADEEKARADGEQKRAKEEQERRKRERDETTDKRPIKLPMKKSGDDDTKKKTLHKKQLSKDLSSSVVAGLPKPKGIMKQPSASKLTGASTAARIQPTAGPSSVPSSKPSGSKATEKPTRPAVIPKPSREKSENIELPDIASEYSDSDDEERNMKKKALPSWAQSPDVRNALTRLNTVNPDAIFGGVRELHMEEIFPGRVSKFRARTSSANWTGTDRLTAEEEEAYAARMRYEQ